MNNIDPTVKITGEVILGDNNCIGPYCVLTGPIQIGNNNKIGPGNIIGEPAEYNSDKVYDLTKKKIIIGDNNVIRESCVIQKPFSSDVTLIGSYCYLMHGTHIAHDNVIQDYVTTSTGVILGGYVTLMRGCTLGIGAHIHQFTVVGPYSMVAMGAPVVKNIRPFMKYIPGKKLSINDHAIKKYGLDRDKILNYFNDSLNIGYGEVSKLIHEFNLLHDSSKRNRLYL